MAQTFHHAFLVGMVYMYVGAHTTFFLTLYFPCKIEQAGELRASTDKYSNCGERLHHTGVFVCARDERRRDKREARDKRRAR